MHVCLAHTLEHIHGALSGNGQLGMEEMKPLKLIESVAIADEIWGS